MNADVREAVAELLLAAGSQPGASSSVSEARTVFDRVVEDGWARVGVPEDLGGSGGDVSDALSVADACGSSMHSLPIPDLVVVAARLLVLARLPLPEAATCALPLLEVARVDAGRISVSAERVPFGRWASHFLVVSGDHTATAVHLIDAADAAVEGGRNLAEEPRDGVTVSGARPIASAEVTRPVRDVLDQLTLAGALTRSVQMAAASDAVLRLTATYCADRRQFGKRLNEFQAVQQELAGVVGEAATARAAVQHAVSAVADAGSADWPVAPIATAKIRTGLAASRVAQSGHQLHGAIGTTLEYPLQRHTRALWSWRDEYGGEQGWAAKLLEISMSDTAVNPWFSLTN